jgi:transposase
MLELLMHEAQMLKQQGKKIGQIAEALGRSERMVHYYLSEPSRPRKERAFSSKLDPFKPYINTILEDDPFINREILLVRLRRQKYNGGITILRDYAAKKSAEITTKAVLRFETEPGYQAQVDWKVLGKHFVDGRWQKLYAFVMVFGYSRKPFVIHTTSMDMATFLMCHVLSFTYFGGVPEESFVRQHENGLYLSGSRRKMAGQQAPVVTGPALWIHTPAVSSQAATDQGEGGTLYPLLRQQLLG